MKEWIDTIGRLHIIQQCLSFLWHNEYYKVWFFDDKIIIWKFEKHNQIFSDNNSRNEESWELYMVINRDT